MQVHAGSNAWSVTCIVCNLGSRFLKLSSTNILRGFSPLP